MVMVAGIAIENVYFKQSLSNFVCLGAFSEGFSFFFFFWRGVEESGMIFPLFPLQFFQNIKHLVKII